MERFDFEIFWGYVVIVVWKINRNFVIVNIDFLNV